MLTRDKSDDQESQDCLGTGPKRHKEGKHLWIVQHPHDKVHTPAQDGLFGEPAFSKWTYGMKVDLYNGLTSGLGAEAVSVTADCSFVADSCLATNSSLVTNTLCR